jgi:hypothetical protein
MQTQLTRSLCTTRNKWISDVRKGAKLELQCCKLGRETTIETRAVNWQTIKIYNISYTMETNEYFATSNQCNHVIEQDPT